MLAFSTAYNFAKARYRPVLREGGSDPRRHLPDDRRLLHALHHPEPDRRLGLGHDHRRCGRSAGVGALGQLFAPKVDRKLWVAVYLALGWLVVVALKPMIDHVYWVALLLLVAGGVVYSTGVIFYVNKRLKFRRAIWHGHVVAAAGAHWAAVLIGVVLARDNS